MGIASLVIGIFAVLGAAVATAPCFGLVALPGALIALLGLGLGVAEFVVSGAKRARGRAVDAESVSAARTGLITNLCALVWCVACFALKQSL